MPATPHTACRQGKRVKVTLKDGTSFIDRFLGQKSTFILFQTRRVNRGQIKSFTIHKGP